MPNEENRTTEHEMAEAVMEILVQKENGCASVGELRDQIPEYIDLTDEDWEVSNSQDPSPKWHQILRNIGSNKNTGGNYMFEGYLDNPEHGIYRITDMGRIRLERER